MKSVDLRAQSTTTENGQKQKVRRNEPVQFSHSLSRQEKGCSATIKKLACPRNHRVIMYNKDVRTGNPGISADFQVK